MGFFLNTEHYKVWIKWSNPAKEKRPTLHFGVVADKKETSIRPRLRLLTLLLLIYIYIYINMDVNKEINPSV